MKEESRRAAVGFDAISARVADRVDRHRGRARFARRAQKRRDRRSRYEITSFTVRINLQTRQMKLSYSYTYFARNTYIRPEVESARDIRYSLDCRIVYRYGVHN